MSKRRTSDANWYELPFEERQAAHGRPRPGRHAPTPAGCCSSSPAPSAFDDWEWGVTLLADDPVALKEIVYEMRFDEVSAVYSDFGPFIVGLLAEPAEAVRRAGLA